MSRRFLPAPLGALGAICASLLLVACGGSGTSTNSAASADASREQQILAFTKCLREHGINVATPTGGGPVKITGAGRGTPQAFEAARTACKRYAPKLGGANLSPAERVAREEALQKFAQVHARTRDQNRSQDR